MELFLFTAELAIALQAEQAGIDSIIVDCESKGKVARQDGYDVEINANTFSDVKNLAQHLKTPITVRINSWKHGAADEIEPALASGAHILMLPMAETATEVEAFLIAVGNRAKTIIQIETPQLINDLAIFSQLSWDYAYIGLNDLMIAYQYPYLWKPLTNNLVAKICQTLAGRQYGLGGTTVISGGCPIDSHLLMNEYVRLGCSLSFLRRSFLRELQDRCMAVEIALIRQFIAASSKRGPLAINIDKEALLKKLAAVYSNKRSS